MDWQLTFTAMSRTTGTSFLLKLINKMKWHVVFPFWVLLPRLPVCKIILFLLTWCMPSLYQIKGLAKCIKCSIVASWFMQIWAHIWPPSPCHQFVLSNSESAQVSTQTFSMIILLIEWLKLNKCITQLLSTLYQNKCAKMISFAHLAINFSNWILFQANQTAVIFVYFITSNVISRAGVRLKSSSKIDSNLLANYFWWDLN